jgi:MtrB/PioB family decaheme-associated outer membrane protein
MNMGTNKYKFSRRFFYRTTTLVLCFAFLFPSTIWAFELVFPPVAFIAATESEEDDGLLRNGFSGNVSLGAGGVHLNRDTFKFGDLTGLDDTTGFAFGDTDLSYNHGPYYVDIFGDDLGLQKRRIYIEGGSYGNFNIYAGYDQTPYLISNFNNSFLDGIGSNTLTLPTGFVTSGSTSGMTITGVDQVDLEVDDRFSFTAGGSKTFGDLKFNLDFKREDKQSTYSIGSVFGTDWANAGSTIAPVAFDQVTHEATATLEYNGENGQAQLQYFFSDFNNQRESFTLENPFTIGATNGLISGDPDNQHHQITLSGGISLNHNTRISAVAEYGIMNQDENLFPFGVGTSTALLPRQTADAQIINTHVGLNMSTQPLPRLSLSAKYKYYQTVNNTPQDLFLKIANDGGAQTTNTSDDALFNLPYDYIQNKINVTGVYKVFSDTSIKMDYEFDDMERSFRAVSETREHTVKGRLKSTHFEHMHFNVNASYANRSVDDYISNNVFVARHLDIVVGLNGAQFEVNPDLRRHDIADRERIKYGASMTFLPGYFINVGINAQFQDDDYNNSILGLLESQNRNLTVDVNYFGKLESLYLFYTYDESDDRQRGREFSSAATSTMTSNDWEALHDDKTHTAGLGGYIGFWNDELVLKADYIFAYGTTAIDLIANSGVSGTATDLPLLETYRHTLKAKAIWQYDDHTDFGIKYIGELFETDDWAKDSITPSSTSYDQVLLLSGSQKDYLGHVGIIYATMYFGGRK